MYTELLSFLNGILEIVIQCELFTCRIWMKGLLSGMSLNKAGRLLNCVDCHLQRVEPNCFCRSNCATRIMLSFSHSELFNISLSSINSSNSGIQKLDLPNLEDDTDITEEVAELPTTIFPPDEDVANSKAAEETFPPEEDVAELTEQLLPPENNVAANEVVKGTFSHEDVANSKAAEGIFPPEDVADCEEAKGILPLEDIADSELAEGRTWQTVRKPKGSYHLRT